MSKLLSGSILRGVIAVLVASALWMFVSFTENPQETSPLTNLPITAEGLAFGTTLVDDQGMAIRAPDAVVNLSVVGPRDALQQINKQTIQPYINLAGLPPGSHTVKIEARAIPAGSDVAFVRVQPPQIVVQIEQLISATVPLSVTTDGQPPTSYEAGAPTITANAQPLEQIQISGPTTQVNKVTNGQIVLDLSSQTSSLFTRRQIVPVDQDGREVKGVAVEPNDAEIAVKILSSSGIKRVPIVYSVENTLPAGLRPEITLDPAFVSIIGSSQTLANVDFIETAPINVADATSDFTREVQLRFPPGVTPRDAAAGETTLATVRVVPIETQFALVLPVVPRNVPPNSSATVAPTTIEVQIKGPIGTLTETTLALVVDVTSRAAGTYELVPSLDLPSGWTLVGALPTVQITLRSTITPTVPPTASPAILPTITPVVPTSTAPITPTPAPDIAPTPTL